MSNIFLKIIAIFIFIGLICMPLLGGIKILTDSKPSGEITTTTLEEINTVHDETKRKNIEITTITNKEILTNQETLTTLIQKSNDEKINTTKKIVASTTKESTTIKPTAPTTEPTIKVESTTVEQIPSPTQSSFQEKSSSNKYIGTMYITGYTAEEGFPEGSATASGHGVRSGHCALNNSQRKSLGLKYGDQIYVKGLGTYIVMDCGCDWGVVDIWVYSNAEAYAMTGYYDVYIV